MNCNWNAIRARVHAVLGAVVNAGCKEQTNGNGKLVASDDGASDFPWAAFGHVENDDSRDEPDTESGNQTTGDQETQTCGCSLQDDTDHEDGASNDDGQPAADEISYITGNDGAKESTGGKDRGDEGVSRCFQGESSGLLVSSIRRGVWFASLLVDKIRHCFHAVDVARVIAEVDTTKGSKGDHEISLPGNWGFDAVDIGGGRHLSDLVVAVGHDDGC